MEESKVREIVAHNNKELLSQIKDLVSSSISDLKRSSDANSAEQMSEIKRLKRDARPSFHKKSNEDQYKAIKCVLEAVEDASSSLERKDLPKTKEHLEKGICFSSGKPGHWRVACPNLLLPSSSQNQQAK